MYTSPTGRQRNVWNHELKTKAAIMIIIVIIHTVNTRCDCCSGVVAVIIAETVSSTVA